MGYYLKVIQVMHIDIWQTELHEFSLTSISMIWAIIVSAGSRPSRKKFPVTSSIRFLRTGKRCSSFTRQRWLIWKRKKWPSVNLLLINCIMKLQQNSRYTHLHQFIIYEPSTLQAWVQKTSYLPSNKNFKWHLRCGGWEFITIRNILAAGITEKLS